MSETTQPVECGACEQSRANAKAAGHRDWASGVCYDHAGTSWDEFMAGLSPADRGEIERLADGMEALNAQAL